MRLSKLMSSQWFVNHKTTSRATLQLYCLFTCGRPSSSDELATVLQDNEKYSFMQNNESKNSLPVLTFSLQCLPSG